MRPDHQLTRGRAGFTLVELIVAILISTVIIGSAWKLLTSNQRFYRSQSQIQDVQQNLRAAVQSVMGDLRELDAKGGDLIAIGDSTSLTLRAMRGFGVVCKTNVGGGQIWLKNSLLFMSGAIDITKDNVMVYREADSTKNTDDTWQPGSISATTTDNCADGTAGTRLTITLANGNAKLDSVQIGAPVRIWEQVLYTLYTTNSTSWLGTDTYTSGAWTGTSAVAGPVTAGNGVTFTYYDSTGAVTATTASIARILLTVRGQSAQAVMVQGRPTGPYKDSVAVSATLRNN
jgi:prepilin-type N-terminal cleavage/methylation domain-containing protein